MSLMNRIKIDDFLSWTYPKQLDFITSLQDKRNKAIEKNKLKPLKKSKAKSTKIKDPIAAATKALSKIKLTPEMIASIKQSYGIT